MNEKLVRLYKLKILSLLHDPINKCYILKYHENESNKIINLFERKTYITLKEELNKCKDADRLSSQIDRILLKKLYDEMDKKEISEKYIPPTIFYNLFSKTYIDLPNNEKEIYNEIDSIDEFYNNLFNELSFFYKRDIDEKEKLKITYFVLWTLLDIYYLNYIKYPLPADTRLPTHDIIDHLYSTATVSNIVDFEKDNYASGYYVFIDIAGVQRFIRASRKIRDTWIGSWLISMIAWKTIEPLLLYFGPDILISPSARLNPLWIISLKNYLQRFEKISIDLNEKYQNLFNLNEDELNLIVAKSSLIPPTISLILPKNVWNKETFKEILKLSINLINSDIIKINVLKKLLDNQDSLDTSLVNEEDLINLLVEKIYCGKTFSEEETINKLIEYLIKIVWLTIETIFEKRCLDLFNLPNNKKFDYSYVIEILLKNFNGSETTRIKYLEFLNKYKNINEIFKKLPFDTRIIIINIDCPINEFSYKKVLKEVQKYQLNKNLKTLKFNNLINFEFYEFTKKVYNNYKYDEKNNTENKIKYEYCTMCSSLPAVFILPYYSENEKEKFEKFLRKIFTKEIKTKRLIAIFRPGERLCPYCFIKRILSGFDESIELLLKVLLNISVDKEKLYIPSTNDFAFFNAFRFLLNNKDKINLNEKEKINKNEIEDFIWHPVVKKLKNSEIEQLVISIMKIYTSDDLKELEDNLKEIKDNLEKLKQYDIHNVKLYNRFFTYIYADGDEMGNLLLGNLSEALSINSIEEIYNDIKTKMLNKITDNKHKQNLEEVFKQIKEFLINKDTKYYEEIFEDIIYLKDCNLKRDKVLTHPISITYHVAISRALIINSIKELKQYVGDFFEKGIFVIYAGGDDLVIMTIAKPETIINTVETTRKLYSCGDSDKIGFYKVGNNYIPTLGLAGRTYSIVVGHFKYPLSFITGEAIRLEKQLKTSYWKIGNNTKKKDSLILELAKRSGDKKIALSPFRVTPIISREEDILYCVNVTHKLWEIYQENKIPSAVLRKYLEDDNKLIISQLLDNITTFNKMLYAYIDSIVQKSVFNVSFSNLIKDYYNVLEIKLKDDNYWIFELWKALIIFNEITNAEI